ALLYEHDANGNMTAVHQWAGSTPPIVATFLPASGHIGTQVTISGTGFDPDPGDNTVTFGGVPASVSSATASMLVATVPSGAPTGPVSVTVNGVTGTSSNSFVVLRPSIVGFSPGVANPGNAVTVIGSSFNLVPGSTSLAVGGTAVTVTSLSNTQAVFNAP